MNLFKSKHTLRTLYLLAGSIMLVCLFHFYGTSVYEDWAHGSLFIWLHCVWKFDSIGAVNYTFSYIIPLVAVWFIWRERKQLHFSHWYYYSKGLILLAFFLILHGIALRAQLPHISAISFIGALWALATSLGGVQIGKKLVFPAIYLTLAIPLSFIERATFPLRSIASKLSVYILNGLAIPVTNVGTAICDVNGTFKLDVADPCSGIRSLLALMALSLAFAKISQLKKTGKIILFLSFLPIAIIANIVRIVTIAFVTKFFGVKLAMGAYHDISGYLVFVIATLLLISLEHVLKKRFYHEEYSKIDYSSQNTNLLQSSCKYTVITLFIILLVAFPYSLRMEKISILRATPIKMFLPKQVAEWNGERIYYDKNDHTSKIIRESEVLENGINPNTGGELVSASYQERIGLPSDTKIIKSIYTYTDGTEFFVTLVMSGETRGSIHKPQWCISAQGFEVVSTSFPKYRTYGDKKVALLDLKMPNKRNNSFFCYWFIGNNHSTPYHTSRVLHMAFDRIIKGHSTRWAYISISGPNSSRISKLIPSFVNKLEHAIMSDSADNYSESGAASL